MNLFLAYPQALAVGMLGMLVFGLLIGLINGVIVVYGKIDSFIGTLAIQVILQGGARILISKPIGPAPKFLKFIANKTLISLPIILFIGALIFILFGLFYKRTRTGRYLYAVGESADGASWPASMGQFGWRLMISSFMSVLAATPCWEEAAPAEPLSMSTSC